MKILVTGASGGLGRLVIEHLLDLGHQVIATSRDKDKAKTLSFNNKVQYVSYDFSGPAPDKLLEYFNKPEAVIHLAWDKLNDYRSIEHETTILQQHRLFLLQLVNEGLKNINVVGTCYEYGLQEGELNETMPSQPVLPYPNAKNILRLELEKVQSETFFDLKWIRVFYVFGEIVGRKNLYTMLNQAIHEHQQSFDMSGGEQIRDFLSPQQIAEIIVNVSLQNKITGIINCCSGKPVKLKDFVMDYIKNQKSSLHLNLGVYPYANYEPMNSWGSIEKLNKIRLKP